MDSIPENAPTNSVGIILRYIGDGAFVNGVPARDLTQTDIEQCGFSVEQLLAFEPRVYERTGSPLAEPTVAVINAETSFGNDDANDRGRTASDEAHIAAKTPSARSNAIRSQRQKEGEA